MKKPKSRRWEIIAQRKKLDLCTGGFRIPITPEQKQELIDLGADPKRIEKMETNSEYRKCRNTLRQQNKSSR